MKDADEEPIDVKFDAIWDFIKGEPEPYGFDPAIIPQWKDGPDSARFGLLRLTPWRIELYKAPPATESRIWKPHH